MPLFESQKSKTDRFFKEALASAISDINETVDDKPTRDIFASWAMGANWLASALVTHSAYVKKLWGKGSQRNADLISKIFIPAMMSRNIWGNADKFPTPEARKREFEENLSPLFNVIFGDSADKFEYFRTYYLNLDIQFNYECDWLQGKVTASQSEGNRWIWDVFQNANEYELNEKQRSMISAYFDTQYNLLINLAGKRVIHHTGTPIFFEFMLWIDIFSQVISGEQFINWSTQTFPIEGPKQLVPAIGSRINQLGIEEDFAAWCAGVAAGQLGITTYLSHFAESPQDSTATQEDLETKNQVAEATVNELSVTLDASYSNVFKAAALSSDTLISVCEKTWNVKLTPLIQASVFVEFYFFYAYMLDRMTFEVLGENGRAFFMDAVVELGLTPLIKHSFPDAGEESWGGMIAEQSNNYDSACEEYATCSVFMLERTESPVEDAFLDNPVALISRLFQNIQDELAQNTPPVSSGSVDVFYEIHAIVLGQVKNMDMRENLKKISGLIAPF